MSRLRQVLVYLNILSLGIVAYIIADMSVYLSFDTGSTFNCFQNNQQRTSMQTKGDFPLGRNQSEN